MTSIFPEFQKVICRTEIADLHSFFKVSIKSSGAKLWEQNELCKGQRRLANKFLDTALVKGHECASQSRIGSGTWLTGETGRKRGTSIVEFTYVRRLAEYKLQFSASCPYTVGRKDFENGGIKQGNLLHDRLCCLVVRVSGYSYRGLGFDSRRYQIF